MGQLREVDFGKYCNMCVHKNDSESDENSPCYECLEVNAKDNSRMPVNFVRE